MLTQPLSILYLRCQARGGDAADYATPTFNSLFEMPPPPPSADPHGAPLRFQFSI